MSQYAASQQPSPSRAMSVDKIPFPREIKRYGSSDSSIYQSAGSSLGSIASMASKARSSKSSLASLGEAVREINVNKQESPKASVVFPFQSDLDAAGVGSYSRSNLMKQAAAKRGGLKPNFSYADAARKGKK